MAVKINQVGAQVKPGKCVIGIRFGFRLSQLQGILPVLIRVPVIPQDGFHRFLFFRRVHEDIDIIEGLPVCFQGLIRHHLIRSALGILQQEGLAAVIIAVHQQVMSRPAVIVWPVTLVNQE